MLVRLSAFRASQALEGKRGDGAESNADRVRLINGKEVGRQIGRGQR
jgi:hypothetical protein